MNQTQECQMPNKLGEKFPKIIILGLKQFKILKVLQNQKKSI